MYLKPNLSKLFSGKVPSAFRQQTCYILVVLACTTQLDAQCGALVSNFPYQEDFEQTQGGWTAGGTGSDWAWGKPNKPTINTASSGQNCWVTGGLNGSFYSLGQRSYVESPCFDFSSLPYPFIRFQIWWESEYKYDGGNLQYSLNEGASWNNVGSATTNGSCLNENWYNNSSITNLNNLTITRHGWCGNIQGTSGSCQGGNGSGGWVMAKHCLEGLGGKPRVKFRFIFGSGTTCNDYDGIAFDDITIENAPPVTANFSSICDGPNTLAFTDLSGNCPDSWDWNFDDPASGNSNTSALQNPSHTFSGPGTYLVSLQAASACSGTSLISFPVEVLGLSTSITLPSCVGGKDGTASVSLPSGGANPVYAWSTNPAQFGPQASNLSAGAYTVTVTAAGICPIVASVLVADPDPVLTPQSNVVQVFSDTTIALGEMVSLSGLIGDPGKVASYFWEPSSYLDCDTCLMTNATPLQTTTYALIALDTNGCRSSDALEIRVLQGSVYIPNIFKPASKDFNDRFTVFAAKDVEQIELLQIYDRWGSLVFENQKFPASDTSFGWDGLIQGETAASGVYLYLAKVRFLNGSIAQYEGDLTVLR